MTGLTIGDIPAEYFAAAWFAFVVTLGHSRDPATTGAVAGGSVIITGVSIWYLVERDPRCWPILVVALAAVSILALSASDESRWTRSHSNTRRRYSVLLVYGACVTALAAGTQSQLAGISRDEALRRDLLRWYESRSVEGGAEEATLIPSDGVRVTVFTDYLGSDDRLDVPQKMATVTQMRQRGLDVEFIARDFPQGRECNVRGRNSSDASCVAAQAVRLARIAGGPEQGAALAMWLYRHGPTLSSESVRLRLTELGLADEYDRKSGALAASLGLDIATANQLGLSSTPVYFLNGVWIPPGAHNLRWILESELSRRTQRP